MGDTANIKIQIDQIEIHDYRLRDLLAKSLLAEGYEITVKPKTDLDGRFISEEMTIYQIEKIALDDKENKRRY